MTFYNRGEQVIQKSNVDHIGREVDSILGTPSPSKTAKIKAYEQSMDTFGREDDDEESSE